jgi:hypothetical protein
LIDKALVRSKKLTLAAAGAWKPQARHLASLLQESIKLGRGQGQANLVPIYLYPQDCQAVGLKAKSQG